ncbi:MAG: dihydroorotate dehydrogenase electron transfer subunit [Prevotellaceae bacterium]|jgi:dihydroorotate dehydrogenase electron transfer subunit|nr:dihydroorotate dehydrogenase electron transfer subunit [Prevotellaceae bacterium]
MSGRNLYTVISNDRLAPNVFKMVLLGDTHHISAPGQFVNIELPGRFLRRPISVCDYDASTITLVYKVVGAGTQQMSELPVATTLDMLTGLGNGFDTSVSGEMPLLVGGGVGIPPLYALAKRLIDEGKRPQVALGFNTASEVFLYEDFRNLGIDAFLATVDGAAGCRGIITDAIVRHKLQYDYLYACGPLPMLKALYDVTAIDGQFSFEERMGCGFGGCMGCSCRTLNGYKRICTEGPVLFRAEILWETAECR